MHFFFVKSYLTMTSKNTDFDIFFETMDLKLKILTL